MVIFIILAVLLVLLGGGFWGFRYACARQSEPDWEDEASLARSMWKDHPMSIPEAARWVRKQGAEDVSVESFDGLRLAGKWIPAEKPIGTIILFHGYHSHYLTDFGGILPRYHALGLNLLLVRQRAHGESEGHYITFGVRERADVLTWIDYHNRTHGADNVFLGGMSMGTSTLLFAAGEALPENVRGITADCGFSTPAEILTITATKQFRFPGQLLLPPVGLFTRLIAGFGVWECDTRKILTRAKTPILFIHGRADDFVPCWMTEAAYAACASEKRLCLVDGAAHGMSYLVEPERVWDELVCFFRSHLSPEFELEGSK